MQIVLFTINYFDLKKKRLINPNELTIGRCIILLNDQVNKRKEKLKLTKKYFNSPSYLFSDKKESDKNQGKRNT